ncbi:MAG: hypothetical protein AVDCRST_MAG71-2328 [uncultured Lysobacter sp.]|uniref:DUF3616 domain-containing protein n=1 Tax=uncultured Lysobacter sp. TaxID=271060 RepID=A0A6J4LUV4_9GAMM|nr:MAG: hypothetical protein AVDCRST_MAG71-2328 [uncultured Lysobacter sp.]
MDIPMPARPVTRPQVASKLPAEAANAPAPVIRATASEKVAGQVDLDFNDHDPGTDEKPIGDDVSALARIGNTLFCATDEGSSIESLAWDGKAQRYGAHRCLPLADVFDLPDGDEGEMDIEGLAIDDGWLWIVGSHSLKRSKLRDGDDLRRMPEIKTDRNRCFLGRMPLVERAPGMFEPVKRDGQRRAAALHIRKDGSNAIRRRLGKDPLLAPFMRAPAKENGFDIEGLAVIGDRVFLGLRGPVISKVAMLVELRITDGGRGGLKLAEVAEGLDYLLHPMLLDGLGVRDLLYVDGRLLILGGASMGLSGPQAIYALDALPARGHHLARDRIHRVMCLPIVDGADHAEGIVMHTDGNTQLLMVVCDSPAPARRKDPRALRADLYRMP